MATLASLGVTERVLCSAVPCRGGGDAQIWMWGYSVGEGHGGGVKLCQYCATQLARKLIEDVCDLAGDRHG